MSGVVRHIIGIVLVLVLVHSLVGPFVFLSLMFIHCGCSSLYPMVLALAKGLVAACSSLVLVSCGCWCWRIRWLACALSCLLMLIRSWRFAVYIMLAWV